MAEEKNVDLNSDEESGQKEGSGKSSLMKILLLAVTGLLVIGGGVGGTLYMTGSFESELVTAADGAENDNPDAKDNDTVALEPAIYLQLDPPFTVSLDNDPQSRYLQLQLAVMAREESVIDAVRRHRPAIRNNLNFLFAVQKHEDIVTKEGKEKLQEMATEEIRQFLKQAGEDDNIEALYFTDFVID